MVANIGPQDASVVVKFGAGLHTRPPEDEIADNEAASGHNFVLDVEDSDLRPRQPFDLIGTAPNAGSIRGGGSFRLANGNVKAFFQAGNKAYAWDGSSFTASPVLGTVDATAKLRGHWRAHSWELDGLLLISAVALKEVVKQWDGSAAFLDVPFKSDPSTSLGSALYCKYISIVDERAFYANLKEATLALPHMIIGSERSNHDVVSIDDRPASALGEGDPFFLLSPDLRAINGFIEAFGVAMISTQLGKMFKLSGASAKDFVFDEYYAGSFAAGDESLAYIGTDIIYGRQGRLESLVDTDKSGDTEANDITKGISDIVKSYASWTTVYNSRLSRVYLFPTGQQEVWVFSTAMRGGDKSPWMRWVTAHALAFQPTFVMSMLDPLDGLEYVFMGDSTGHIYRLEGTGSAGDGGSASIQTQWTSKLFSLPLNALCNRVQGYVKYRRGDTVDVTVELLYAGEAVFDQGVTITLPEITASHYSDNLYYSDGNYYGSAFVERMVRQRIEIPGGDANEFQVRVTVDSPNMFDINEIGLRFSAKT